MPGPENEMLQAIDRSEIMLLRDANDGEMIQLSCGCEGERIEELLNGFVQVHTLYPCWKHPQRAGVKHAVEGGDVLGEIDDGSEENQDRD